MFAQPLQLPAKRTATTAAPRRFPHHDDGPVMQTNDDAAVSKLSAVKLGYWKDDFLQFFVKNSSRRPPLINRGYHTRVLVIHSLLEQFLRAGGPQVPKQVVCFGAGFDTTFFLKKAENVIKDNVVYYELDLPEVVQRKIAIITKHPELKNILGNEDDIRIKEGEVHTNHYHLMGVDLRSIDNVDRALTSVGLDKREEQCASIIQWAAMFKDAAFVTYEQILPDDAFGRMMLKNLEERGVHLHGLRSRPTLQIQKETYLSLGWKSVEALDMNTISNIYLDRNEIARLNKIEMFDEVEEWRLTQAHYCVVCATKDSASSSPSPSPSSSPLWDGFSILSNYHAKNEK